MPDLVEVPIPGPGTSDARAGRWLGFASDCECDVEANLLGVPGMKQPDGGPPIEVPVACTDHTNDTTVTDTCAHVINPGCGLHAGWTPGKTAMIVRRPGAFADDVDVD